MRRALALLAALPLLLAAGERLDFSKSENNWTVNCFYDAVREGPLCQLYGRGEGRAGEPVFVLVEEYAPDSYEVRISLDAALGSRLVAAVDNNAGVATEVVNPVGVYSNHAAFCTHEETAARAAVCEHGAAPRLLAELKWGRTLFVTFSPADGGAPRTASVPLIGFGAMLNTYREMLRLHDIVGRG